MSQYFLTQDKDYCVGCLSCEVYCQKNKDLPEGPRLCQIVVIGKQKVQNLLRETYIYMGCFHCDHPICVAACPTGAMVKSQMDGIVYVNESKCVGCASCVVACPWGAVQWNPKTKKAIKCDLCKDRLVQGLKPVCVTVCTTSCLQFRSMDISE